MPPWLYIPQGLITLYRSSLTTVAQVIPYQFYNHTETAARTATNQNKGTVPWSAHINTISARISSLSSVWVSTRQLAVSSLSKGNSSVLNFHKSIGTISGIIGENLINWASLLTRGPGPGADPGFFKRGGAQIKDWQNFGACGDRGCLRGMCPLRGGEKL